MGEEAEDAEPVIHADDDDALLGEIATILAVEYLLQSPIDTFQQA